MNFGRGSKRFIFKTQLSLVQFISLHKTITVKFWLVENSCGWDVFVWLTKQLPKVWMVPKLSIFPPEVRTLVSLFNKRLSETAVGPGDEEEAGLTKQWMKLLLHLISTVTCSQEAQQHYSGSDTAKKRSPWWMFQGSVSLRFLLPYVALSYWSLTYNAVWNMSLEI